MEKFKIQEKGGLKIINLDQVTYITAGARGSGRPRSPPPRCPR